MTREFKLMAVTLCLVASLPYSISAQDYTTAAQMLSNCRSISNSKVLSNRQLVFPRSLGFDDGTCWGAFATLQRLSARSLRQQRTKTMTNACPPPESSLLQIVRVFVRYADLHPEAQHKRWEEVALDALWKAFPCER